MADVKTIPALRRYVQECLRVDMSQRMALAAYRAAGGEIRTDDFRMVWQDEQTKAARGAA